MLKGGGKECNLIVFVLRSSRCFTLDHFERLIGKLFQKNLLYRLDNVIWVEDRKGNPMKVLTMGLKFDSETL